MEIIKTSSRGQIVIPEHVRNRHKIKEGTRLILFEQGDKIILEKEDKIKNILMRDLDDKGWSALSETGLREVWDNEKDAEVWKKYL